MATLSVTITTGCPRLAAPDRHRPASTLHGHPAALVTKRIA
jgi:hypothetical protein